MSGDLSTNALLTGCEVYKGKNAVERNSNAVMQIYDAIKTSYGPLGLDKMCIDATGYVSVTNDGATILKNMLIDDATAKLLTNLALEQDKEVGDGTTSVVLLACNLISKGAELIQDGVHASIVVSGYRMAFNECIKYIKTKIAKKIQIDDSFFSSEKSILNSIIETSISSKILSQENEVFVKIVKKALKNCYNDNRYNVSGIKVLKSLGGSLGESEFFNGYILNCSVASRLMPKYLNKPKVLCIGFSLNKEKLPLTASITVNDAVRLEEIRKEEIELTKRKCQAIIDSGANIVLSTGGMDELCIKMFVDNGIVAVRRCDREDLKTIAQAFGTSLKDSIVDLDNEYKVNGLGECEFYEKKEIGDHELVFLSGSTTNLATVLIRGPNSQIADEAERSLNDALQVSKRTLESKSIVPGGGAVEAALSFMLEDFSSKVNCREHIAIHRYAESLLEIPRILSSNAGLNANQLVAKLLSSQLKLFESGETDKFLGLDVVKGEIQDNLSFGIVEPAVYKLKALKAATEAAIAILRINEIVKFPEN